MHKKALLLLSTLTLVACSPQQDETQDVSEEEPVAVESVTIEIENDSEYLGEEDTTFYGEVANFSDIVDDIIQYSVDNNILLIEGTTNEPMHPEAKQTPAVFYGYFGLRPDRMDEFSEYLEGAGLVRQDDHELPNEEDSMILVHVEVLEK